MKNSFTPNYQRSIGPDNSTVLSFDERHFWPESVSVGWIFFTVFIFAPTSCVGSAVLTSKQDISMAIGLSILVGLWAIYWRLTKSRPNTVTVYPDSGIQFDGKTLPFDVVQLLGITTKTTKLGKAWAYVHAESGGREIRLTKWMTETQARALSQEIQDLSSRQWT